MAVNFDNSIISRIQQATDIVDVISEHLSLQKKGKELVGLCPFHADHKPSLYVNPVKQIFKCFACGAGGDVFKFIQLREGLGFPQAIERLAQRAGIKLQSRPKRPKESADETSQGLDPKYLANINARALKLWQENLNDDQKGKAAREYIQDRQITTESVKKWALGLALNSWDDLAARAKSGKSNPQVLTEAGLTVAGENDRHYDKFRNRLMFPILDVTGRVVGFGGRTLGDDPAKYMNSPATSLFDKSNCLYGLDKARHDIVATGTAVIVEGYTDVIMAHQFGCKNVVATLGTSLTAGHARILRRYAKKIILVFDSDTAGTQAANRGLEVCLTQRIDIKLAFVPEGKDPCDFLISAGLDAFQNVLADAVDVMEFKWQRLIGGLAESDNFADKRAATEEFLLTVATAISRGRLDPIAKGLVINKLTGIIGLTGDQINRQLVRLTARLRRAEGFAVKNQKVLSVDLGDGFLAKAQREVLEVLLNEPKLFSEIDGRITVENFDVPVLRQIARVVFASLNQGSLDPIAKLLAGLKSVEAGSAIVELAEAGPKKGNYAERLAHAVDVIRDNIDNTEKSRIKDQLSDDDTESLRKIFERLGRENKRNPGMVAM